MREYTASLLFIHPTFGVWANRKELFLLRIAQKGIAFCSPFAQYVYLRLFQQELTRCPSGFRKKEKNILIMISDRNSPHCRCPYPTLSAQPCPALPCPARGLFQPQISQWPTEMLLLKGGKENNHGFFGFRSGRFSVNVLFVYFSLLHISCPWLNINQGKPKQMRHSLLILQQNAGALTE